MSRPKNNVIRSRRSLVVAIGAAIVSNTLAAAGEPAVDKFIRLGQLHGDVGTRTVNVSGNGHRVLGFSIGIDGAERGVWWSPFGGAVPLRGAALGDVARPYGLSFDGRMITGAYGHEFEALDAALWIVPGSSIAQPLGELDPKQPGSTIGLDMTPDGAIVVGAADACSCDMASQAFRWTLATGIEGLGFLDDDLFPYYSRAHAVSAAGAIIVGVAEIGIDDDGDGIEEDRLRVAMRYTDGLGMVALGDLDGGIFDSRAADVSADGLVIVGAGTGVAGPEACRWREIDGMVGLGDLPGGLFGSEALGVSGDGGVIVGFGEGPDGGEAVVWIDGVLHPLTALVEQAGYDIGPGGFVLTTATAVSDDGRIIVGSGEQDGVEHGWMLRLAR